MAGLGLGTAKTAAESKTSHASTVPQYTVTDIGELPTIADAVSIALNDAGTVAIWTAGDGGSIACVKWSAAGVNRLDPPPGYLSVIPAAIGAQGELGGWVTTASNPVDSLATIRGVMYTDGKARVLATLGGRDSRVFGMGQNGECVGMSDTADRSRHAFAEQDGKLTDLGTLRGGSFSCAYAIDKQGRIAGVSDIGQGIRHAVTWTRGKIHDVGLLPHGQSSCALAINGKGDVAGYATCGREVHAFRSKGGKMIDLGDLGDDPSMARGINDNGDVVGKCAVSQILSHAFLWRAGKMYDLNDLIPKSSTMLLRSADAINNAGQIVCEATDHAGVPHAVRLDPAP